MSERKVVGQRARRRDTDASPVVTNWKTDIIENAESGFSYQFFRNDEVRDKLRPTRVRLQDFDTGESSVHDIPGWQIVNRETGPEEAAGYRPDEGAPIDSVLRHGPHVCMKIPTESWEILQRAQEQRADAYETRLRGGHQESWSVSGQHRALMPGEKGIKLREEFSPYMKD